MVEKAPISDMVLPKDIPAPISSEPSLENTQAFYSALSCPIDDKGLPKPFVYTHSHLQTPEQWAQKWEVRGMHLGTDAGQREIMEVYGVRSRQQFFQVLKRLDNQSYKAAPAALREVFPRDILPVRKPRTLRMRMFKSEKQGGSLREVVEEVLAGSSNEEIRNRAHTSVSRLSGYRSLGIPVPYDVEAQGKEYQENLKYLAIGLLDNRQIIDLFQEIEANKRRAICARLAEMGILVGLRKAAREAKARIKKGRTMNAYQWLISRGVPAIYMLHGSDALLEDPSTGSFYVLKNHKETKIAFADPEFKQFSPKPPIAN